MTEKRLKWDEVGAKLFETGTERGVLFVQSKEGAYKAGVPWNGLIAVKQQTEGGEENPIYANNKKYLALSSKEEFKGTIEAYFYPDEWKICDGSKEVQKGVYAGQQSRAGFGLVYSTIVGNDTQEIDFSEKIHIIYNAKAAPSSREYSTINKDPEALTFSWSFNTTPEAIPEELLSKGITPTSYFEIDCRKLKPETVTKLKDKIYGKGEIESAMPSISELVTLLTEI